MRYRVARIGNHVDRLRRPARRCLRGFRHRLQAVSSVKSVREREALERYL